MRNTLLISVILLALACGGRKKSKTQESTSASGSPTSTADATQEAAADTTRTDSAYVFFKYPEDGAVVTSPVYVEMGVLGMEVEPAGKVRAGFGHHHILINQTSWPRGEVIPMSDTTIHYGKGQTSTELDLPPGEYTLGMQFADGVHVSYGKPMAAAIHITVE